ncbi:hypothetical protein R70211_05298 [Paraburkholderia domus]|uniref:Uncharacterized protein n=2 Tax=Paraburkholderia domus TaxID=2793075 RepID=A0A9N8N0T9_9BURK|nr:hypothetical protein [Burkholderia sp. R-70211]CAE6934313.1 hypothetical protein R70211_05298 [Paraburkholderia domus]
MKGNNAYAAGQRRQVPVALGRLELLNSFADRPKLAEGLPDNMPVLTFPLKPYEARYVPMNPTSMCFGFGHMELSDRMLMTMRLQFAGTQLYWIAEMTDPELWAAIDMWRKYQRVPIGLKIDHGDGWNKVFVNVDWEIKTLRDEKYRAGPQRDATAQDWREMAGLVTGYVQGQATTDIDDTPLQYVFASALLTKQYEKVANGEEPLVRKLVTVRAADGNGAVVLF